VVEDAHIVLECLKKSDEQFKSEVFDLVGNDYEVLSRYNNDRTKVTMKHVRCEYQYEVTPSHFLQGRRCPNCSVRRGVFNNKYNPKLTENDRINRRVKYGKSIIEWRSQVYKKDNYTCQHCSAQGNYLNAHHINGYNWYEAGRFDVNNGATLCRECHKLFHKIYGHGYNTKEQFEDFLKNKAII
jgi:5-methylcytosine-specific restriction endonuclease McrA